MTEWGCGNDGGCPVAGASHEKPPFRKRGVGGILYLHLHLHACIYTYTSPRTTASLMLCCTPLAGRGIDGGCCVSFRTSGKSPQPPFCERGAFKGLRQRPALAPSFPLTPCRHSRLPHRHSRLPYRHSRPYTVIPAKAGIHLPGVIPSIPSAAHRHSGVGRNPEPRRQGWVFGKVVGKGGGLSPFREWRGGRCYSGGHCYMRRVPGFWIPAYAGMTVGWRRE